MSRKNLDAVLTHGLNPQQARAVTSEHPRLLLIAGAGAGKTAVLTRRVVNLIARGVPPELILCVTFTRKAAGEMAERIERLLHEHLPGAKVPEIRTLHAWGAQMIRRYADHFGLTPDFSVYDEKDREDVLRLVARERNHKSWERGKLETLLKDDGVRNGYAERLLTGNAIDFDMIERYTLRLIEEHPEVQVRWTQFYRHVLVDEYQDTNLAQVAILRGVRPDNLCVVGDPRQAIYSFRGAEVRTIVEHARDSDFEVIELTANYRSVPEVVAYGNGCVEGDWAPMVSGREVLVDVPVTPRLEDEVALANARGDDRFLHAYEWTEAGPSRWAMMTRLRSLDGVTVGWRTTEWDPRRVEGYTFRHEPALVAGLVRELRRRGRRWGDIAVLARNWAALEAIRDNLVAGGIPVNFCGQDEDPWATDDGRAVARALLLAHNGNDDNLAALLSEWGALGRRRFASLASLRVEALRARRSLLWSMAQRDPEWERTFARLNGRVGAWSPADHVRAFLDGLGVLDTYTERGLSTRVATITGLLAELPKRCSTLEEFAEWWMGRSQVERLDTTRDAVHVLTVHGAKGLEWPVVVLADARAGVFPTGRVKATEEDRHEDLRVFYVGVTRARDHLIVTCPTRVKDPWTGAVEPATPSPFLDRPAGPGRTLTEWRPVRWGGSLPSSWSPV